MSSLISEVKEYRLGKEGREYYLNFRSTGVRQEEKEDSDFSNNDDL